jgi:hypothetical protein
MDKYAIIMKICPIETLRLMINIPKQQVIQLLPPNPWPVPG